jgi:hypothetical protein
VAVRGREIFEIREENSQRVQGHEALCPYNPDKSKFFLRNVFALARS